MSTRRLLSFAAASLLAGACAEPRQTPPPPDAATEPTAAPAHAPSPPPATCTREGESSMRPVEPGRGQAVQLYRDGHRRIAIVADADDKALHSLDVDTLETVAITSLPEAPSQLVALEDGRLAVSYRHANQVAILEPGPTAEDGFTPRCDKKVASEPVGLAARGERLLVASGYGRALTELDTQRLDEARVEPLGRAPRAVAIASDGDTAYVSHAVGGRVSAVDLRAEPRDTITVDLRVGRTGAILPENRQLRDANQGFALALSTPFGGGDERLFAPQVGVDTGANEQPITSGYGSSEVGPRALAPFVASIDSRHQRLTHEVATERSEGALCTLPRAAVAQGDRLWLACAGIDSVLELDARMADPTVVEHRRFAVAAGPEGLALDGERLVVWSRYDRELQRINLTTGDVRRERLASRRDSTLTAQYARGRVLFHRTRDQRISSGLRACASCHPDGLDDGLVWSSPDGRRQTKVLAGRLTDSAPYGWFGKHETLTSHLESTFGRLGGSGFHGPSDAEDLAALVHFIETMPAPRPEARDDALVARGHELFESGEQGCGNCHDGGRTNGSAYDVGSAPKRATRNRMFDTPSLRFLADSAPYYHDGRYQTLRELFADTDGLMGHTSSLSPRDLDALESYLRTL